jgi:hypothetical protein
LGYTVCLKESLLEIVRLHFYFEGNVMRAISFVMFGFVLTPIVFAQTKSVVLVNMPVPTTQAEFLNAMVRVEQELHPLKARFERQRARNLRTTNARDEVEATEDGGMRLRPIEVIATETEAPGLSEGARLRKSIDAAMDTERVRVGLGAGQQVIHGSPLPGSVWQAWTNPGNIHFWLR